jgi:hypothetical protein
MIERSFTGDEFPASCEIIEVRVSDLREIFNAIDPAPLPERDLHPRIEKFIVEWSREVPRQTPLALQVRLDRPEDAAHDASLLRDAVHGFFAAQAQTSRRQLRRLFHIGRISLGIGLAVLAALTVAAQLIATRTSGDGFGQILQESLSIGGWVAMWRPLEIFLYEWWPIRADAKLFDRLATMPVRIRYEAGAPSRGRR